MIGPELKILGKGVAIVMNNGYRMEELESSVNFLINCAYHGAERIIIFEEQLPPAFFNLSTGWAGEILQKVATYKLFLAIIGEWSKYDNKNFQAFILESNRTARILFAESTDQVMLQWKIS